MKHTKCILVTFILSFFSLGLISCEGKNNDVATYYDESGLDSDEFKGSPKDSTQNQQGSAMQEVKDSVNGLKERIVSLDSKYSELVSKMENIESSTNGVKDKLNDLENNNKLSVIIGWSLALISIIVAIIAILKTNSLKNRLNHYRNSIGQLKQELDNIKLSLPTKNSYVRSNYSGSQSVTKSQYDELLREINNLKIQIRQNPTSLPPNNIQLKHNSSDKPNTTAKKEKGFFSQVIKGGEDKGYFKKLQSSRDSDSRFSVLIDGNYAEFKPIVQVREITSSDAMDLAVDYKGVGKNEANSMTVASSGKAQLSGDKWIIIEKAVVILNK